MFLLLASLNDFKTKGQAKQLISICKLKPLRVLHTKPINLVIYKVLSGTSILKGGFALICLQRLSFPNIATQHLQLALQLEH